MPLDKVAKDVVVSMHYKLYGEDGLLIEESEGDDPLMYLHGHSNIIDGLEKEVTGLKVGDSRSVTVTPEEGYGEFDADAIQVFERAALPDDFTPELGMGLQLVDEAGNAQLVFVTEITEKTITLDGNHPMAGQTLRFEIEVVALREPTSEELDHGHVHQHGHHH